MRCRYRIIHEITTEVPLTDEQLTMMAGAAAVQIIEPEDAPDTEDVITDIEKIGELPSCKKELGGFLCTRVVGHPGNHVAHGMNSRHVREWSA